MKSSLIGLCLFSCALARADEALDRANADFQQGRFREAATAYEELLQRDGPRAAVLQNLGSAYYRLGDDGRAILAFERALVLKPGDPDLRANLKLAREQAAVFPDREPNAWERFSQRLSLREWSQLAMVAAALLPVAMLLGVSLRRRGAKVACALTAGVAVSGAVLAWLVLRQRHDETRRGIVLIDRAALKLSPFASSDARGSLDAGQAVQLGEIKDGFRWVRSEGSGAEGWLAADEVAAVMPEEA